MYRKLFSAILILLFLFCGGNVQKADLVLKNGKIVTIDKNNSEVEALAVIGDKIMSLGTSEDIEKYIGNKTKVIDLKGKLAIPGFIDAHTHFASGGRSLKILNFRGVDSIEEIQKKIKEKVEELPDGAVIYGRGYDHTLFPNQKWPSKEDLDKVAPNNPVVITRVDGHSCWVNSMALKQSGITKETEAPFGGSIQKDKNGEPTGILKEKAQSLLDLEGPEVVEGKVKSDLEVAIDYAAKVGVTSVHTSTTLDELERFKKLRDDGKLTLRVYGWLPVSGLDEYIEKEIKQGQGDNMVKIGFIKMYIDGTLGSGTALLFEPFKDDPSTSGLSMYKEDEFYELFTKAHKHGYQIGVHAIGSKGVHWVLNAVEKAQEKFGKKGLRHRIEHAQLIIPEDVQRFNELGVVASMQPTHCTTDMRFCEIRVGLERCENAYIWKTLLNNDVHLAFGTDWPVEPLDPMRGIYSAVARKNIEGNYPEGGWFPEQRLSMSEAIMQYTLGSAYASFEEDIKGSLEKGKLADIVVLSKDLFNISHREILETKPVYTILGGKIVYESNNN